VPDKKTTETAHSLVFMPGLKKGRMLKQPSCLFMYRLQKTINFKKATFSSPATITDYLFPGNPYQTVN
jgi:hypothetical protein